MDNYLKEAYNIKQKIISDKKNMIYIKQIVECNSAIKNVNINSDNVVYVETDNKNNIINSIDNNIDKLIDNKIPFSIALLFNILPLSSNSYIIKI